MALSRSFLSRAQVLTICLCSALGVLACEVASLQMKCSAEPKLKLCLVCAGLVPGFRAIPSMLRFCRTGDRQPWTGAVHPAGTLGKEREEEGTAGKGKQNVLGLARLQHL